MLSPVQYLLKLFYGSFSSFHVRGTNSFLFSFSSVFIYSHLQQLFHPSREVANFTLIKTSLCYFNSNTQLSSTSKHLLSFNSAQGHPINQQQQHNQCWRFLAFQIYIQLLKSSQYFSLNPPTLSALYQALQVINTCNVKSGTPYHSLPTHSARKICRKENE